MVAPFIFLFVFAGLEFGRAMMAFHSVESAAMEGCRKGTLSGTTVEDVEARVALAMSAAGIADYTVTVEPESLNDLEEMSPVTVTVTTNYSDISWLPMPSFMDGINLIGACTLPREANSH